MSLIIAVIATYDASSFTGELFTMEMELGLGIDRGVRDVALLSGLLIPITRIANLVLHSSDASCN